MADTPREVSAICGCLCLGYKSHSHKPRLPVYSQHNNHIPYTLLYIGPCLPAVMAGTAAVIALFSHIIDGKLSDVAKKEYICIR